MYVEGLSTTILEGNVPVKTFELDKSGIGYYINPKPACEPGTVVEFSCDGGSTQSFTITHESDLYDWYVPIHMKSGRRLGPTFLLETDAQRFVQSVSSLIDWTKNADELPLQAGWHKVGEEVKKLTN